MSLAIEPVIARPDAALPMTDDNGLADQDGALEQGFMSAGLGAFG